MKIYLKGSKKWNGRPVYVTTENAGAGSFLEPPFSKTHKWGIVAGYDRGNGYQEYSSVDYYLEDEHVPEEAKIQIRQIIGKEERPDITDPEVHDWICRVMGYFKHSYRNPVTGSWNAGELKIDVNSNPEYTIAHQDGHAGVHLIRKYYPEFKLTEEILRCAYWGKKTE